MSQISPQGEQSTSGEISTLTAINNLTPAPLQAIAKTGQGTFTTISVGGTPTTFVENEVVNGSDFTWTLAATPIAGSVKLHGIGQRLTPGSSNDYTISGRNIITVNQFSAGSILADYRT